MDAATAARDPWLLVGDGILAIGVIPILVFLIDYAVINPYRQRKNPMFVPWWKIKGAYGWLVFLLALGLFAVESNVVAALIFTFITGFPDYAGRPIFRIIGYTISTVSTVALVGIYAREHSGSGMLQHGERHLFPENTRPSTRR